MKFVCDRCQTRYSISDEKVRQKILRIRCKTCGNVIVVQDRSGEHPAPEMTQPPSGGAKTGKAVSSVETRSAGSPPPLPQRGAKRKGADRLGGGVEWYVAIDGVRSGPISRAEVAQRIVAAGSGKEIHVWKEGMVDWKSPREVSVIARELNRLIPPAPPPLPRSSTPPPASKLAPGGKTVASAGGASVHAAPGADAPPSDDIDEMGGPAATVVDNVFGDVTTQKMEGMEGLVAASAKTGFEEDEATTKKGKNLRIVESESIFESSPTVIDSEATPPPVQPLPPLGGKHPAVPSVPAPSRPAPSLTPPPALSRTPIPSLPIPSLPHGPAAARGVPPFVAPIRATPISPLTVPGTPVPPISGSPLLPPTRSPLPTPQPVMPYGSDVVPVVSLEYPVVPSGPASLLQRRPGLKYVVAALAIVALIILLGLVILRSTREKLDTPVPVGASEPGKPEPAPTRPVASEPTPSEPTPSEPAPSEPAQGAVAQADPIKPDPVKVENREPTRAAPAAERPAPKRGGKRSGRTQASASERPPRSKPEPKPPRLGGARPNPFDEVKGVTQSQITAVVRNPANQSSLKSCYERALKMDNHLTSGRMDVTVSIRSSGTVERVVVNAPSSFILVEPCIKGVVKRWRFPANTEDYGTNFPLILQGGM